jgi:hypothetical protein
MTLRCVVPGGNAVGFTVPRPANDAPAGRHDIARARPRDARRPTTDLPRPSPPPARQADRRTRPRGRSAAPGHPAVRRAFTITADGAAALVVAPGIDATVDPVTGAATPAAAPARLFA